ncbi:MAG: ethylbenzene dehydrogenase-related protein [Burkholderiales bacterium]|nr:ethylbenzene dehydrogenase-related protein [Burkholderiales bacterium]
MAGRSFALVVAAAALAAAQAVAAQSELAAPRIAQPGPILDPGAAFWKTAKEVAVPMLAQTAVPPLHPKPAVKELRVRAVHNGQWLAFRLQWNDPTRDDTMLTDRFGDQVAVQLPIELKKDAMPSPMMGNPGGRVNILQWRAAFQRDLAEGEPEVRKLYPYAQVDVYPDQVLRATDARPYTGALGLDNPVSRPRASPVLDQMAEGWGTMTVKTEQEADGRGEWANGVWTVVITLPLATGTPNTPRLSPGASTIAAFAVWDGGSGEVGSRKAWSSWLPLRLAK